MSDSDSSGVGIVLLVRSLTIGLGIGVMATFLSLWIVRECSIPSFALEQTVWFGLGTGLLAFGLSLPRR